MSDNVVTASILLMIIIGTGWMYNYLSNQDLSPEESPKKYRKNYQNQPDSRDYSPTHDSWPSDNSGDTWSYNYDSNSHSSDSYGGDSCDSGGSDGGGSDGGCDSGGD